MQFFSVIGVLLIILLFMALMIRSRKWRNRRQVNRRVGLDRRVRPGSRTSTNPEYGKSFPDRRASTDRRGRHLTRRLKKRRMEDRLGYC